MDQSEVKSYDEKQSVEHDAPDIASEGRWGYRGGCPTAIRPSDPPLCGSCPLVTPYQCRLGDLCLFCVYPFLYLLLYVDMCDLVVFVLCFFLYSFLLQYFDNVGLLACKNRLPYNL